MAADMFAKWDKEVDTKGLAADVKTAEESGGNRQYAEIPHGKYEVSVHQMELKASKKGDPMVSIWFKILEGQHKGSFIFMNQLVNEGFKIHIVDELLRSLVSEAADAPDIVFESFTQYGNLIMDVMECINDNFEYVLDYGENNKGFDTYKIDEVFVLQ